MLFRILLTCLSVALLVPNFLNRDVNHNMLYDGREQYNPQLARLNSVDKVEAYTDSLAQSKQIPTHSFEYLQLLETVIKERFYQGFSHFTLSENWIAAVGGNLLDEGLACKVNPSDILQHGNAACSQQSLVMMAILRRKTIDYRKIGFPHHYALEARCGIDWFFLDADMEPVLSCTERNARYWQYHNDELKRFYDENRFTDLDYKFGVGLQAERGILNEVPARKVAAFHLFTAFLSKVLWLVPLAFMVRVPRLRFSASHIRLFSVFSRIRRSEPALQV